MRPEQIRRNMAAFDQQAIDTRIERHAELALFARKHELTNLEERHAQIDEMGPWETKAFEMLSRGADPGVAALAFVQQFIANSYGDPKRGLQP